MKVGKVTIPFLPLAECDVPIVKFNIGDKPHYAIVDTGAETTIIDPSLKDQLSSISEENVILVGVSGEKQAEKTYTGELKIWMKNDKGHIFITTVKGFLNDISHISNHFINKTIYQEKVTMILGSDMLNNLNAKVDFIKKEVHFKL